MELFVVNRHGNEPLEKSKDEHDEQKKLQQLYKKIEKNKAKRQNMKEKQKLKKLHKKETLKERAEKRNKNDTKELLTNTHDEFIDKNLNEPEIPSNEETTLKVSASTEDFTVLGNDSFEKKTKVKRVLPKWLMTPTVISINLQNLERKVKDIKLLHKSLRKKLKENGIHYLFPVQSEVIPWLLKANKHSNILFPRDICVSAPTGSGKTLAFVLPVVQSLMHHTIKKIRALVILPTQDLANQVYKTFKTYTQDTTLSVTLITGKNSFSNEQKQLIFDNEAFGHLSKIDILVCTAGRLVEHIKLTKGFSLKHLEYLIIDEADRVLETVQNDWLYHLEKHIYQDEPPATRVLNLLNLKKPRPPQKLLFSATLSQDPEKLQKLSLFQPKLFTSIVQSDAEEPKAIADQENTETFIGKYTTPNELTEKFIISTMEIKPLVLFEFIRRENLTKCLVFTHSIESTHRLMILLKCLFENEKNIKEISSNLEPKERNNLITEFEKGTIDVLICTDALARGIDLPKVQCVISYSAPKYIKTYIHRVGRTARAGETGLAITLINKTQLMQFKKMLQQANKQNLEEIKISEEDLESYTEKYKEALTNLKTKVQVEGQRELKKINATKRLMLKDNNSKVKKKRLDSTSKNNK